MKNLGSLVKKTRRRKILRRTGLPNLAQRRWEVKHRCLGSGPSRHRSSLCQVPSFAVQIFNKERFRVPRVASIYYFWKFDGRKIVSIEVHTKKKPFVTVRRRLASLPLWSRVTRIAGLLAPRPSPRKYLQYPPRVATRQN